MNGNPLSTVGAGASRLLEMIKLPAWGEKMVSLRQRASSGDYQAQQLLSMLGVASVALGSALGMGAGRLMGEKRPVVGPAVGGLLGAAPALFAGDEPPPPRSEPNWGNVA